MASLFDKFISFFSIPCIGLFFRKKGFEKIIEDLKQ